MAEIAKFNLFAADGNFRLGFDPDCHYWNDGVKFKFYTSTVPEPMTISLLASGCLIGGIGLRRRGATRAKQPVWRNPEPETHSSIGLKVRGFLVHG